MYGLLSKQAFGGPKLEELKERCSRCGGSLFTMKWNERAAISFCNNEKCLSYRTPEPVTIPEEASPPEQLQIVPPEQMQIVPPGWLANGCRIRRITKRKYKRRKEANNV